MDHDEATSKFTVQGRDTPVPVQSLSGRAGSPGPSANDRSAPSVGTQADGGYNATGGVIEGTRDEAGSSSEREEAICFTRSRKTIRTPPMGRGSSLPGRLEGKKKLPLPWEDESLPVVQTGKEKSGAVAETASTEQVVIDDSRRVLRIPLQNAGAIAAALEKGKESPLDVTSDSGGDELLSRPSKKRKAKGSPPAPPTKMEPSALLMDLKHKIEELVTFGKKNQNVHKEVKRLASELSSLVYKCITENKHDKSIRVSLERENRELQSLCLSKTDVVEVACQTEEYTPSRNRGEDEDRIDVRDMELDTLGKVKAVLDKKWTRNSYVCTSVVSGDPLMENFDSLLFFANLNQDRQEKDVRRYLDRYPELMHSEVTSCPGGSYVGVEQIVRYKGSREGLVNRSRNIFCMNVDDREGQDLIDNTLGLMSELKDIAMNADNREILVIAPRGTNGGHFRKLCEIVFRDTGLTVKVNSIRVPSDEISVKSSRRKKAIVIERSGSSYAETLRELKSKITDQESIKEIGRIRRTAKGDVLLTLEGDGDQVCKKIEAAMKGRKVRRVGGRKDKTIIVRDIDSLQTLDDVRRGLLEAIDAQEEDRANVKAMRPTVDGNQLASVEMNEADARSLLQKGSIRIGLSLCRVRERIQLMKCFRCWGYGHKASDCTGVDRSDRCLRCAAQGHCRQECEGHAYCPLCDKEHEAGSGRCATFREALETARSKRSNYGS